MERTRRVDDPHAPLTARRPAEPAPEETLLRLSAALGNQAFARLARQQRMLQRTVWRWTGSRWVYESGDRDSERPDWPGRRVGERFDDEVDDSSDESSEESSMEEEDEKPPTKRKREEAADPVLSWVETDADVKTAPQYDEVSPETVFHLIKKSDKTQACFEWALRGLGNTGPSPEQFWYWLMGHTREEPAWLQPLAADIEKELKRMMRQMTRTPLIRLERTDFAPINKAGAREKAKVVVIRAMEILAEQCGFKVVGDDAAAGWVVCQYKVTEGAAFPEHFWLEVRGSDGSIIVVQTVSGLPIIEIGGTDLRWHSESSAEGRGDEAEQYELIRIPVEAFLPTQMAILKQGMETEGKRKKPSPKEKVTTSAARGGRGGRGRGRGRGRR